MEKRIRILAWIHTLLGGIPFCLGLLLVVSVFADRSATAYTREMVGGFFFWFSVGLFLPSFVSGLGLLFHQRWARATTVLVSIEVLLLFPVGTALGVFGLLTLLGKSTAPASAVSRPRPLRINRPASGVLPVILGVGAAFVLVLSVGLNLLNPNRPGMGTGVLLGVGLVALAAAISVALLRWRGFLRGDPRPLPVQRAPELRATSIPTQVSACVHLQPVEHAMQSAGIPMKNNTAQCRVHAPALNREFGTLATYSEYFQPERYFEDNPTGRIGCRQCPGGIYTLHPQECSLQTPWFPDGPPPLVLMAERRPAAETAVTAMAASATGRVLAVASGSRQTAADLAIWDIASSQSLRRFAGEGVIRALAWSSNERTLFAARGVLWSGGPGSPGASIFVLDAGSGQELVRFGAGLFGVRGMALSPDGRTLLISAMLGKTAADGSALDLLDATSGRLISRLAVLDGSVPGWLPQFNGVAFTPHGVLAIAACSAKATQVPASQWGNREMPWWWSRGVRIWRVADGQELNLIPLSSRVATVAVSDDGSRLFAAGDRMSVWNLSDASQVWNKANFMDYAMATSPDGRLVARGIGWKKDNHGPYRDCAVELYDGLTGQFLTWGEHRTTPAAMAFVSNGSLAVGEVEGQLRFWKRD